MKKTAIIVVNPVNGSGLFQYLEAFYENGIAFKTFAAADTTAVKTNSGVALTTDDIVVNLKGHAAEYGALVFACGDAMPKFAQNADKPYNVAMLAALKEFDKEDKILIGHCAAALMFDSLAVCKGKRMASHPMAKPAIKNGFGADEEYVIAGNLFTARDENSIWQMLPAVVQALK